MGSGFDEVYAGRNTPEAQAELASLRAANEAKRRDNLVRDLKRFGGDSLLPGGLEAIAKAHPELAHGDAATRAVRVYEFLGGPAGDQYKRPEAVPMREQPTLDFNLNSGGPPVVRQPVATKPAGPKQDALRQALSLFAADFKTPALLEKFYSEHALTYSHADPSSAVQFVASAMADRKYKAYQKSPIPPSERVRRVAELLKPWAHQLKTDEHELAESWPDLVDPLRPAMPDVDLERTILVRLSLPHNAQHLRVEEFDPTDARGERAGGRRREAQQQQQAPAAEPTWAEANAAQFRRRGL